MKSRAARTHRDERGILLVDCLVYISLFFIVLTVSYSFFYAGWDGSLALRRNIDDITSALRVGEAWRADIRKAVRPLRTEDGSGSQVLHIPTASGEILYKFTADSLWRQAGKNSPWSPVLPKVKTSRMTIEHRHQTIACRWELELPAKKKTLQVHPLFTFEAVPNLPAHP